MGAFGSASSFPTLQSGDLRHWITFLNQQVVPGLAGNKIIWVAASPPEGAWAKIEAIRGTDLIRSGQDSSILYLTLSIWYRSDVKAQMHLIAPSGAEYVINSVENVLEMNHITIINAQAIGSQSNLGG